MIVADSSVFASVIVKDEFYDVCKRVVTSKKTTVDLAYAETANVLWKHVKIGRIPPGEVDRRVELLRKLIGTSRVFRVEELMTDAVGLAVDSNITVYDALFVALAVKLNTKLITTDRKLVEGLKGTKLETFMELVG